MFVDKYNFGTSIVKAFFIAKTEIIYCERNGIWILNSGNGLPTWICGLDRFDRLCFLKD